MIIVLLTLAAVLLAIEGARRLRQSRSLVCAGQLPLPPGPAPLPFLGNVLGVNRNAPHLTYTAWSKIYGDIIYTHVLGINVILLNSERIAVALLEKRSQKYSDRPELSVANLLNVEWFSSLARYGPRFRLHRRLLHQVFHTKAALGYRDKQLKRAYELLKHLLDDPAQYSEHFTTFSAAIVVQLTYGYDMKGGETFVSAMHRVVDIMATVTTPETCALCTAFPFVKVLPSWLPGMGWKSKVAQCRHLVADGLNTPYTWVRQRIGQGNAVPCMVSDAIIRHGLDDDAKDPELARAIKESAGTLYAASVEATHSTLLVFVYLMMNHPDVQRRAQLEIDRVVGGQRLPELEDRPMLPFIDAVLRETLRCHPVVPLGAPHATIEDDVYDGYYIPRGATILPNVWAISHDEERYPNPEMFAPKRFLCDDGSLNDDKVAYAFGFGRRIWKACRGYFTMVCDGVYAEVVPDRKDKRVREREVVHWARGISTAFPMPVCPERQGDGFTKAGLVDLCQLYNLVISLPHNYAVVSEEQACCGMIAAAASDEYLLTVLFSAHKHYVLPLNYIMVVPEIQLKVFVMFPLDPTDTEPPNLDWVHCLTFPIDTLNNLQFSSKPYKWICYATGAVVGAQGDLSFSSDSPHDVMDYDHDLRHESANLYYHTSQAERKNMFPVDPDMGRTTLAGSESRSEVSSRRAGFRSEVVERDGLCVLTNYFRAPFCEAVHLLPHCKGDEYIENYTQHRTRDPHGTDIVCDIDDVRNGILLNPIAHITFGTEIAFLMTPNFAMSTTDVDPTGTAPATEKRCTAHLFNPDTPEAFGDSRVHSGHQVRMPETTDDWPPDILFDAVYASAVLCHFSTQTMRDTLARWKSKIYPKGIADTAQVAKKRKNEQSQARDQRAAKRANRTEDGVDYLDCLMILPYLMVPPDKQEEVWTKADEKRAERERSRVEDKVADWARDVANA